MIIDKKAADISALFNLLPFTKTLCLEGIVTLVCFQRVKAGRGEWSSFKRFIVIILPLNADLVMTLPRNQWELTKERNRRTIKAGDGPSW